MSSVAECAEAIGGTPYVGYEFGGTVSRKIKRETKSETVAAVAAALVDHVETDVLFHAGNRTTTIEGDSQNPEPGDVVSFAVDLAANDQDKLAAAMAALGELGFNVPPVQDDSDA